MNNLQNIDERIYRYVFSGDNDVKKNLACEIKEEGASKGIKLASIHNLYMAFGNKEVSGFTVPAFNIRTMTYDTARIIFSVAKENNIGPFIFEIARSEMNYTRQDPEEYVTAIIAAAIKENYQGPVFIQGDHFQFKNSVFKTDPQTEINNIKDLINRSIEAGFYNIDIDASTLVDLTKTDLDEQQKNNYRMTALITKHIRSIEPKGITVSVGGEIGHIGGKNSTVGDFEAFMEGYLKEIANHKLQITKGISKVSVQTGTSHGGVPLPDGPIAKVNLDFEVLQTVTKVAREKYRIGGSVQHGASTLPNELFYRFPEKNTLEIHLATGFQNIVYQYMPKKLREEIYQWIKNNLKNEWKTELNEEQFIYKTRKKALGVFKEKIWKMTDDEKKPIRENLKKQFTFLFEKLGVFNTKTVISRYL
jgi:fructose/tagatose bisphosphate aldolase